jgi:hypothetical protein
MNGYGQHRPPPLILYARYALHVADAGVTCLLLYDTRRCMDGSCLLSSLFYNLQRNLRLGASHHLQFRALVQQISTKGYGLLPRSSVVVR